MKEIDNDQTISGPEIRLKEEAKLIAILSREKMHLV
jgi:hypothetical protein